MQNLLFKSRGAVPLVRNTLRPFAGGQLKGSFELSYDIPPRYFLMTYQLKNAEDLHSDPTYESHRQMIKENLEQQRIILNGETLE